MLDDDEKAAVRMLARDVPGDAAQRAVDGVVGRPGGVPLPRPVELPRVAARYRRRLAAKERGA